MNKMSVETFNCLPCKYKITKKHLYEKHLKSDTHLKVQAKADLKVQAKADLKVQAKADLKVQAKANAEADLKVQAKADTQAQSSSEVQAKADTEAESNKTSVTVKEKQKQLCVCGNYYKSLLAHQKSCQTFKKEKGNVSDNANANPTTPNIDYPAPINKTLYEKATADFKKYMGDNDDDDIQNTIENLKDNDSTTITNIVDDAGNTIIKKTTY